jgi:hypothetical protein
MDANHEFSFDMWTPGTTVSLHRVAWNADYRDIVKFKDHKELDKYLFRESEATQTIVFDRMSYARVGEPIRIPLPFNNAYTYNYIRVHNAVQPIGERPGYGDGNGRTFYYFIQDMRRAAPNTTEIFVQLDVWQSFFPYVTFNSAYIERGHVGIADESSHSKAAINQLCEPEGLDLGNDYTVSGVWSKHIANLKSQPGDNYYDSYGVIVYSTVKLEEDWGTLDNPKLKSATGNTMEGLPNGMAAYYFDSVSSYITFTQKLQDFPWISQGISAVYMVPSELVKTENCATVDKFDGCYIPSQTAIEKFVTFTLVDNVLDGMPQSFQNGCFRYLTKFLTYPYTYIEVTTNTGTPIVLKPERMNELSTFNVNRTLPVKMTMACHVAQPSPRIVFHPTDYNVNTYIKHNYHDSGEALAMTTGVNNLPMFSVTNNSYLAFMASNAHSIAYQHDSANWSQQKALTANQLGYDQSSAGLDLQQSLTNMAVASSQAQLGVRSQAAYQGMGVGMIGDLASAVGTNPGAGIGSALTRGVSTGISVNADTQSTAIANDLAQSQTSARVSTGQYMRDSNKTYADYAAKGDYANTIGAINARVQDSKLTQPTVSGQVGGEAFLLATTGMHIQARLKTLSPGTMAMIGGYWLRYGYAVNRYTNQLPRDLQCMSTFTYWKLRELYLSASWCPENYKQTIRGIFEKGVTVWHDPSAIGITILENNEPIYGYYLSQRGY